MVNTAPEAFSGTWDIIDVDAGWDDESGQIELRIEAQSELFGFKSEREHRWIRLSRNHFGGSRHCLKFKFRHSKRGSHRPHRPDLWSEMRASKDF